MVYETERSARMVAKGLRPSARLVIPDVLRGVAIIAMLIAHAGPFVPQAPWAVKFIIGSFSDVASPLFALVMGMSAELLWRRGTRVRATLLQQTLRGLFLILLGLWMDSWGSWVAVVLSYLGVLIIVGAPILLARTPIVVAVALTVLIASQPLLDLARSWLWVYTAPLPVRELMTWLVMGPQYRVTNLLPFFLLGALLVRQGLRRNRWHWAVGILSVLAYSAWAVGQKVGDVHSGDYLDTLKDLALVFSVYLCVVPAATVRRRRAQRIWGRVLSPIRACGQLSLSLYLLHVSLIALWNNTQGRPVENLYLGFLLIVPGMIAAGWLWWRFIGTGPLEWVMGWLTGRPKPLRPLDR